ncbi:tRNA (5-methylaminomethyl-2-thiouridylate)-methyltransferase [Nitrosopumilus sp.]|uniref:tRNA (5-methylaminomethyl-2-thiouridylate)-methyltransferase n=1 Tax=Nitrosopumilus sp. TaxID=2024843 RepID=UPI003B5A0F52
MYDAKFVYGNLLVHIMSESNADLQKTETATITNTKDDNDKIKTEKKKVVALLSGGLDSQLAVRMMQEQGFDVSAVAIKTPFCDFDCGRGCGFEIRERADDLNVNLKTVYLGDEYIEMLKNPKHGIGAGFNPCIDCRAMMFDAAKKHMDDIGAEFIISGEVLGQRPMSQHGPALRTIEKEAGLVGKIVRPLSAALLPPTDPEKDGLIKRENLGMIRGRTRRNQLDMAKEYGIENPPNAGGGCLLTDPQFGIKAKDLFEHTETPTINDIDLLKIGRHFRLDDKTKLVVGRNKDENEMIKAIALPGDILLEAKDHVGPISILRGENAKSHTEFASSVTLRYSDAPKDKKEVVLIKGDNLSEEFSSESAKEESYIKLRI